MLNPPSDTALLLGGGIDPECDACGLELRRSGAAAWLFLDALPWLRSLDAGGRPLRPLGPDDDDGPPEHLLFVGAKARSRLRLQARIARELANRLVETEALRSPALPSAVAVAADTHAIDASLDVTAAVGIALDGFRRTLLARADIARACASIESVASLTCLDLGAPRARTEAEGAAGDLGADVLDLVVGAFAAPFRHEIADVAVVVLRGEPLFGTVDEQADRLLGHLIGTGISAYHERIVDLGEQGEEATQAAPYRSR